MDYELEMGYFISQPVPYGEDMPIAEAKEHIFGFVMLNDWSARDHQLFEMRPLGPFHSKGFGTSISDWIGNKSQPDLNSIFILTHRRSANGSPRALRLPSEH